MDMRAVVWSWRRLCPDRYRDASALASSAARGLEPTFPRSPVRGPGKQIFDAVEGIDRESVEEAQKLISRLSDSVFGHARNEHRASRLDRNVPALKAHDSGAGEHVIDFGRLVPMQPEPVAGLKFGDAASHALRLGQPLGE